MSRLGMKKKISPINRKITYFINQKKNTPILEGIKRQGGLSILRASSTRLCFFLNLRESDSNLDIFHLMHAFCFLITLHISLFNKPGLFLPLPLHLAGICLLCTLHIYICSLKFIHISDADRPLINISQSKAPTSLIIP